MAKRLIILVVALLALGFVVTGCGDDEKADTVDQVVTDTDTATATDDETVTDDESVTDTVTDETATEQGGGAKAPENVEQAVEQCQQGINAAAQLSDDAKGKLKDICEKAATGDPEDVREAAQEVCREIIEDTFPSEAPGREEALESCDRQ